MRFCLFLFFIFVSQVAFAGNVTLTTFYPAPAGNYSQLRLAPHADSSTVSSCDANHEGTMYYNKTDDVAYICRETGSGFSWDPAGSNSFPTGAVIMWSGSSASVPAGWQSCNGTNGTPDLRDRFIVGAGSTYSLNNTGGADFVTLSQAQMPSHTHTGSTSAAGSHSHSLNLNMGTMNFSSGSGGTGYHVWNGKPSTTSSGNHTHTMSLDNTGGGQAHENRPPYYALSFICKQ